MKDPEPDDSDDERAVLGEGSFGITYLMTNVHDRGPYAVKCIRISKAKANNASMESIEAAPTTDRKGHFRVSVLVFNSNDRLSYLCICW